MTTLLQILAATLLSSILSIVLAGLISFKFLDRVHEQDALYFGRSFADSSLYAFAS